MCKEQTLFLSNSVFQSVLENLLKLVNSMRKKKWIRLDTEHWVHQKYVNVFRSHFLFDYVNNCLLSCLKLITELDVI